MLTTPPQDTLQTFYYLARGMEAEAYLSQYHVAAPRHGNSSLDMDMQVYIMFHN